LDLVNTELTVRGQRLDRLSGTRWWREWLDYEHHRIEPILGGPITDQMRSAATLDEVRTLRALARDAIDTARTGHHTASGTDAQLNLGPLFATHTSLHTAAGAAAGAPWAATPYRLSSVEDSYHEHPQFPGYDAGCEALCTVLVHAVLDLVTSPQTEHIRLCAGQGCTQLFLAIRPSRKWCSSWACGNRARAARHYQSRRGTIEP
jgi:hypothetical protein